MNFEIIDRTPLLTTSRFFEGGSEITRNFAPGNEAMLRSVMSSTQIYFLAQRFSNDELKRRLKDTLKERNEEIDNLAKRILEDEKPEQ